MTETIVNWITLLAVGWTAFMLTATLLIERRRQTMSNKAADIMGIERQTEVCDASLAKPTKGIVGAGRGEGG